MAVSRTLKKQELYISLLKKIFASSSQREQNRYEEVFNKLIVEDDFKSPFIKLLKTFFTLYKVDVEEDIIKIFKVFVTVYPLEADEQIEEICDELTTYDYNAVEAIKSDYDALKDKTACSRYHIKETSLNMAMALVLEELVSASIKKDLGKVKNSVLLDAVNNSTSGKIKAIDKKHLAEKAIKQLRCLEIVYFSKDDSNKKTTLYHIDLLEWFYQRKYYIANEKLFGKLLPVFVAYIKSSSNTDKEEFFETIDAILEYVIQPYKDHNENFALEKYLLDNIGYTVQIRVLDKTGNSDDFLEINGVKLFSKILKVEPKGILFGKYGKELKCLGTQNIPLNEIIRIIVDKNKIPTLAKVTKSFTTQLEYVKDKKHYYIYNTGHIRDKKAWEYYKEDREKIILELPSTVLEYFQMKPLANMTIYATQNEIIDFKKQKGTKATTPKQNHFYVIAEDTIENATSIIMHILNDVQIIEPKVLIESVQKNIEQFISKHPQKKM